MEKKEKVYKTGQSLQNNWPMKIYPVNPLPFKPVLMTQEKLASENIDRKVENAGNQYFLLFLRWFFCPFKGKKSLFM